MSAQVLIPGRSPHPWYQREEEAGLERPSIGQGIDNVGHKTPKPRTNGRSETRQPLIPARLSRSPSNSNGTSPIPSRKSPAIRPLSPCLSLSSSSARAKKSVHWRDASEGKHLARICLFSRYDEPKRCNKHSGNPFGSHLACRSPVTSNCELTYDKGCVPANRSELMKVLKEKTVQVETIFLRNYSICLTIRVLNIAFDKRVFIRYTTDNWNTCKDVDASFMFGGSDAVSDRFYWSFTCPTGISELQFAVCYQVDGKEYWSNCDGENYRIYSAQSSV